LGDVESWQCFNPKLITDITALKKQGVTKRQYIHHPLVQVFGVLAVFDADHVLLIIEKSLKPSDTSSVSPHI